MYIVRLSSKGQVVLPKKLRTDLGWQQGQAFQVRTDNERLVLEPLSQTNDWRKWRGAFAGTRAWQGLAEEHRAELQEDR